MGITVRIGIAWVLFRHEPVDCPQRVTRRSARGETVIW
jgi:hypothetical protein